MSRRKKAARRFHKGRLTLLILAGAALCLAFGLGLWWGGGSPPHRPVVKKATPAPAAKPRPKAKVKAPPAPRPTPTPVQPKPQAAPKPRVAFIIDDMGFGLEPLERLLALDLPLAVSVLPYSPQAAQVANQAHARGLVVMLHLPMEPKDHPSQNPGPGALLCAMSPAEIAAALERDLAKVPHASGVNNHMGSRFSLHPRLLEPVLRILKQRGLFYVDSFTSADSQGLATARRLGLATARRDVFLDHQINRAHIDRQMKRLLKLAKQRGQVIAIGHPHPVTLAALKDWAPRLRKEAQVVKVSRLVKAGN